LMECQAENQFVVAAHSVVDFGGELAVRVQSGIDVDTLD
jgi:hypothetical protein